MKRFLRENLLIVVSIALPLLVVLFFVLASELPRLYVSAPAHDLVLSARVPGANRTSPVQVELLVLDGKIKLRVHKPENGGNGDMPRIFVYEHARDTVREIGIQLPEDIEDLPDGSELVVPELSGLTVDTSLRAPDGYVYLGARRRVGSMMGLFGSSRVRNEVMIEKDGAIRAIHLPVVASYWYGEPRFIGWVVASAR
ncbi:MAG TPA: hypothetical protein ENK16_00890 [Chromatiales bacterium]|nr:hypothetical protein [Chromatiales bacterium]